ncbi:HNH endonuclease signature motif containing protein [Pseudonocardia parietis]|uniref:5-methylcytosine-specific restriction protein A n=1 Tax=Pseudonocardia parietis TaxID=570936 RepID=A0ABS4W533_9PSEU|nr:HNH endonuclease signature motif containing protein [Pseudonocardia parietis]MBP2371096.1 5-methylcytosine-specific restriction protein A [Pseudonocardia parietis]
MSTDVAAATDRLTEAVEQLRAALAGAGDDDLLDGLRACEATTRRLDHVAVDTLAAVERRGVFTDRGYRSSTTALADLLRWERGQARRHTIAAQHVITRTGLDATVLPPVLPATATVFAGGEISLRHTEVIASVLGSRAAARLDPATWATAEEKLAEQALDHTPTELHTWGTQLIEALDQDGPEPDDNDGPEPQINELRLVRHRNRPGGKLTGRFDDAALFDAIATVLDAKSCPRSADETRTPAERAAEALAEVCGFALSHGPTSLVPDTGGRRPQLNVLVRLEDLEQRARAAMPDFGGQLSPEALRMLACDAAVIPIVLDGAGQPLDVGRATRTIPDGLRRAVTARDQGCAHPGCDRPPSWCEIHHVLAWEHDGETKLENLVMLCRTHHRLIHYSGWTVQIRDGLPEFIPPGWIDAGRRPRRRSGPVVTTDDTGQVRGVRVANFEDTG